MSIGEILSHVIERKLGEIGIYLLEEECKGLGTSLSNIRSEHLPELTKRLEKTLSMILGERYARYSIQDFQIPT